MPESLWARLLAWMSQEHWLIGASLTRVMLGAWAIYYYALHYSVRDVLWGPHGVWPHERFLESGPFLSIWQLGASERFFQVAYIGGIAIAVAFTLGCWSRLAGALHWLMIWSLQERNPFITDGGDNIMRIVLLFLVLVNTGAHFSLDARRPRPQAPVLRQLLAIAHNIGLLLILTQLSMLYMSTGLYKAMGEMWQNGTALYYILRVDEFSWPGIAELIYRNAYLVVLGTYGTVLFEIAFFPALFNRWTRYLAMLAGVGFHVGISLFMGLVTFGWSMLSLYPMLITDGEYRHLAARFRRRFDLVVLYDGWCPLCTRSAQWWSRLDVLSLVHFVSFRDPAVIERYGVDAARAARRIQAVGWRGTVCEGMDALLAIAARILVLWPALPVLLAARAVAGQRPYDSVARRRPVVIPGTCGGRCRLDQRPPGDPEGVGPAQM